MNLIYQYLFPASAGESMHLDHVQWSKGQNACIKGPGTRFFVNKRPHLAHINMHYFTCKDKDTVDNVSTPFINGRQD